MSSVDLSIIIVNYHSADYVATCLKSIREQTTEVTYEAIVVDNASFDGCRERLEMDFPEARYVQSDSNLGFGRANNLGARRASGEMLLFLNPDTEIEGDALGLLLSQFRASPDAGIVGPKLLNSDRSIQTSSIRVFPSIATEILDFDFLQRKFPNCALWKLGPLFADSMVSAAVDAVSGASLLIKRVVFEAVGGFSADYFMYSEDIDICWKARKAGWKTYYVPKSIVVHHGGGSTKESRVNNFSNVLMLESRWRFFRKTRPGWYGWLYRLSMLSVSVIRISLLLFVWPARKAFDKAASIEAALRKWAARLRWTVGLEGWVQKY